MNDQEPGDNGTPLDNTVGGLHGSLALKELELEVTDVKGLLGVRKQLTSEEIREVRVTWVDSNAAPSVIKT